MTQNNIHKYNPDLKALARQLRKNSTLAEVLFWRNVKGKVFGYEFHRQVPIDEFIVDFYCHELNLVIEIDGNTHNYNYDHDEFRQRKLEGLGIRVVRFNDEDVKKHMIDVLRMVQYKIEEIEKMKTSP
jgi:very-short-patch-repair endonuclease